MDSRHSLLVKSALIAPDNCFLSGSVFVVERILSFYGLQRYESTLSRDDRGLSIPARRRDEAWKNRFSDLCDADVPIRPFARSSKQRRIAETTGQLDADASRDAEALS
jgi:hypothetical protein